LQASAAARSFRAVPASSIFRRTTPGSSLIPDQRRQDIAKWVTPLLPLRDAAAIVLRLARESGQASKVMAMQGSYQQMLSGRSYQLMQVRVAPELRVIPEASANKYMLWVRFMVQDGDLRPRAVDVDVPFQLTLCSL
jgi:cell division protein ZapD